VRRAGGAAAARDGGLALLLLAGAALVPSGLVASLRETHARPLDPALASHLAAARVVPLAEFTRDGANRITGRVVDEQGFPVAAAEVEVFRKADLWRWHRADEAPRPERVLHSDADGQFHGEGLSYGNKYVLARAAPALQASLEDVTFLDGSGAQELELVLAPTDEWSVRIVDPSGAPVANERVLVVPEGLLAAPVEGRTNVAGELALTAAQAALVRNAAWLVVGTPGAVARATRAETEVVVPEARPLRVLVSGAAGGQELRVHLVPGETPHLGAWTGTRSGSSAGELVVPRVPLGAYGLLVEQGERAGWLELEHDGTVQVLTLEERWSVALRVEDPHGNPLAVEWLWQPSPPRCPPGAAADRRLWMEQTDLLARRGRSDASGTIQLEQLPRRGGWLVAHVGDHATQSFALDPEAGAATLRFAPSAWVSLRSYLPFLPIHVEDARGWKALYETDAFGELRLLLPHGPFVARTRFSRGRLSVPVGGWSGAPGEPLHFGLGHVLAGEPGVVHGFVRSEAGAPVSEAEVVLTGAGFPRTTSTDASGYYRFQAVKPGPLQVVVRAKGELPSVLWPQDGRIDARTTEVRRDLTLWNGTLELQGIPAGRTWLGLSNELDQPLRFVEVRTQPLRVNGLKPGRYRLFWSDREGTRNEPWLEFTLEPGAGPRSISAVSG